MDRGLNKKASHSLDRVAFMVCAAAATVFAGCGEEPRLVRLVRLAPQADPACGAPTDARTLRVAGVGDFAGSDGTARSVEIGLTEPLSIDAFPAETRALEVEVLGAGGALRSVGRTEEFDGSALEDGQEIGVFMAPPDGVCPTGPPAHARSGALAAVSGDDVVIVGGVDASGAPVTRPEIYRSREARFVEIDQELYGDVDDGLVGASLTPMTDGRIALIGGGQNAFQVYTAETGRFSEPPLLFPQARAFHAAVALDDDQVFLAGGCTVVEDGGCADGTETISTAILRITTGDIKNGPPLTFLRVGAKAFLESDGRVIVVGGSFAGNPVLSAERIDPQDREPSEVLSGSGQVGVRLVSGAIVTAFGPGEAPNGDGTAFAPGGTAGSSLVGAGARGDPTLTALQSGQVLAFGGAGGVGESPAEAALFAPISGRWSETRVATESRRAHASAALPDGSVLIVGGRRADDEHLGGALVFRPGLLGPLTGTLSINFADASADQLVPRDRGAVNIVAATNDTPAYLDMAARATDGGAPGEWAVVAAPLLGRSTIELTAASTAGLALLTAFEEPTTFRVTLVAPGLPISVVDIQAANVVAVPSCTGEAISETDLGRRARWRHQTDADRIQLFYEERLVLDCEAPIIRSGRVGVGPLGVAGTNLALFQLTVSR